MCSNFIWDVCHGPLKSKMVGEPEKRQKDLISSSAPETT